MKAKIFIFLIVVISMAFSPYAENNGNVPPGIIKSFIKAVFELPYMSSVDIAKNYMVFEKKESKDLNRSEMLAYQLNKLRTEKKKFYDSTALQILSYDQLPKDRQLEFMDKRNVYGVYMSDNFITYIFTKGNRIISFDYMLKGGKGYYIEY